MVEAARRRGCLPAVLGRWGLQEPRGLLLPYPLLPSHPAFLSYGLINHYSGVHCQPVLPWGHWWGWGEGCREKAPAMHREGTKSRLEAGVRASGKPLSPQNHPQTSPPHPWPPGDGSNLVQGFRQGAALRGWRTQDLEGLISILIYSFLFFFFLMAKTSSSCFTLLIQNFLRQDLNRDQALVFLFADKLSTL